MVHGSPLTNDCHTPTADGGIQDYDSDGIITDKTTADILLQDIWDHGHTDRGIIGPIGGLVTANRVNIDTNGMAGWDFDDGSSTPSVNGSLVMHYSTVQFSGCNQEYPSGRRGAGGELLRPEFSGGYGDGIGTPTGTGIECGHRSQPVSVQHPGRHRLRPRRHRSYTRSPSPAASYIGNMGAGPKWGPAFTVGSWSRSNED